MGLIDRILNNKNLEFESEEPDEIITSDNNRFKGTITKVHEKGYGFIISKSVPFTRIFFHWTGLNQDTLKFPELKEGMKVEFDHIKKPDNTGKLQDRAIKINVVK